jgi:hypothetical protein
MERPQEAIPELPETFEFDFSPLVPETQFSWGKFLAAVLGIILGFLFLGVAAWRFSDWWLSRKSTEELLSRLYKRIYRYGRWSGIKFQPGDTAYQFAENLTATMREIGLESYFADWFLQGEGMVREMTVQFVQHLFNPRHAQVESRQVFQLYQQLRPRLWYLVLLRKAYPYRVLRPFLWENPPILIPVSAEENS